MPKFESPLGSKTINNPNMRDLEIPDASNIKLDQQAMMDFAGRLQDQTPQLNLEDQAKLEKEIREKREAQRTGREPVSGAGKTRIEMLINMLRQTREVVLDGQIYTLQSLKSKEVREATAATMQFDGTVEFSFEMRKQILARSLIKVAGIDISSFLNSNDLDMKLAFIEELDHSFLTRIYQEYLTLANEVSDKYAIKNEQEAKEVIEDLKK